MFYRKASSSGFGCTQERSGVLERNEVRITVEKNGENGVLHS